MVSAPGILLAMATYDGKDSCISVGFITGIRVGDIGISFAYDENKVDVWFTKSKSDGTGIGSSPGMDTFLNL